MILTAPVGAGDLIDRITILEIKADRFDDPGKRAAAVAALDALTAVADKLPRSDALHARTQDLRAVNQTLWDIENQLRDHEARGDFGDAFVALARSVYRVNDRRAAIKSAIDALTGAGPSDPKELSAY